MILAGDVGGTKTLIGLFRCDDRRPILIDVRSFPTIEYDGLEAIIDAFYRAQPARPDVTVAAFGVAGPVIAQRAQMTNVPWRVDATEVRRAFGFARVDLLNDLESMATSLPVLEAGELKPLQHGVRHVEGNIALIAAGTGLGEAILHRIDAGYVPLASEGGHADFAARTDRELEFVRHLRGRYGRAELEHVLSGRGLLNLAEFTHGTDRCHALGADPADGPASVSASALGGACPSCAEALELFVAAYGAAAGNLALAAVATGGLFVGGGIAPRVLPALEREAFLQAFRDKGPMRPLLEHVPVHVILNPQAGLVGAAVHANGVALRGQS